ncbi:MAG TPA: hypothetical protein GX504_07400 [Clostridia bacterium]|nr:hypothetical protein [Clostridia bacterium]
MEHQESSCELAAFMKSVSTRGSVEVTLDLAGLGDRAEGPVLGGQLLAKYISNRDNHRMAFILAL